MDINLIPKIVNWVFALVGLYGSFKTIVDEKEKRERWRATTLAALTSSTLVTTGVLLLRHGGALQELEFWTYDLLTVLRFYQSADENIVIINVTDEDVSKDTIKQRGERAPSISDEKLLEVLQKLSKEKFRPTTIGVDIYRDYPIDDALTLEQREFLTQSIVGGSNLEPDQDSNDSKEAGSSVNNNIFWICKHADRSAGVEGISPPPETSEIPSEDPEDQSQSRKVGFADQIEDSDGVLRRYLLAVSGNQQIDPAICNADSSLALLTAIHYLQNTDYNASKENNRSKEIRDVAPLIPKEKGEQFRISYYSRISDENDPRLKHEFSVFYNLKPPERLGPYLNLRSYLLDDFNSDGYQILLNYYPYYRKDESFVDKVYSVEDFLDEEFAGTTKDKLVFIGVDAPKHRLDKGDSKESLDYWTTPYTRYLGTILGTNPEGLPGDTSGVTIQAYAASHIINAVQGNQPLIRFNHIGIDVLSIWFWSTLGSLAAIWISSKRYRIIAGIYLTAFLCWLSWYQLSVVGIWFPFIPSLIAMAVCGLWFSRFWYRKDLKELEAKTNDANVDTGRALPKLPEPGEKKPGNSGEPFSIDPSPLHSGSPETPNSPETPKTPETSDEQDLLSEDSYEENQ